MNWQPRKPNTQTDGDYVVKSLVKKIESGFTSSSFNDLLGEEVENFAEWLATNRKKKVTRAQLRRFFQDVRAIQTRVKGSKNTEEIEEMLVLLKMLKAKAHYAEGQGKIPKEFTRVIDSSVVTICKNLNNSREEFTNFAKFFEALVGYHYGFAKS
jgi:CRISPR type III-A-associated protein Csm2